MSIINWRVIRLHPDDPAIRSTYAVAVHGRIQVGHAQRVDARPHAVWWKSSADTLLGLEESSGYGSGALGVSGTQASGYSIGPTGIQAARWSLGGPQVILATPHSGGHAQGAEGTGGSKNGQAFFWNQGGMPQVLHPAGALGSRVYGVHAHRQAGVITTATGDQAALWDGTAESLVLLHPEGALVSQAFGIYGDRQVGHAVYRACLWRDAAHRLTDLHPAGYQTSVARAVHRQYQVGWASKKGKDRAGFWQETSESWMDLHQYLPGHYSVSNALGIWSHANFIRVAGWAYNQKLSRGEAMLWSGKVIVPTVPRPPRAPLLPVHPGRS